MSKHTPGPWQETVGPVIITRRRVNRDRLATGFGFAWLYIYDLTVGGVKKVEGLSLLSSARMRARTIAKAEGR